MGGSGLFYYDPNTIYDGEWIRGEDGNIVHHGFGVYKSGDYSYTGSFAKGVFHGTGNFAFASGASYEVRCRHGLRAMDSQYRRLSVQWDTMSLCESMGAV